MHFVEREQETLTDNFADEVLKQAAEDRSTSDEITLQLKSKPVIDEDESFANLATRIVDEVISTKSPKSLAEQVLEQAGISTINDVAEPKIFNGHLRHVGKRARKVSRNQNLSRELKIRRVKRTVRGPPPNLKRMGAPPQTRSRPSIGMGMKSDNQPETQRIFAVNQRKSADCLGDNSTNCQKGGLSRCLQWQLWT